MTWIQNQEIDAIYEKMINYFLLICFFLIFIIKESRGIIYLTWHAPSNVMGFTTDTSSPLYPGGMRCSLKL